jgi:hypothetical protein
MERDGGLRALIAGSLGFYKFWWGDVMATAQSLATNDWHGGTEHFNTNCHSAPHSAQPLRVEEARGWAHDANFSGPEPRSASARLCASPFCLCPGRYAFVASPWTTIH